MAYSAPTSKSTGTLITAAIWNQDIVANLNAAFPLGVGAWTAYTPTNTNITVGNGTLVARYTRVGRLTVVMWDLLFGSTTAFSGTVNAGLPVTSAATGRWSGAASLLDAGTQNYAAGIVVGPATSSAVFQREAGGGINATIPFTWTTNDRLSFTLTYEAAS